MSAMLSLAQFVNCVSGDSKYMMTISHAFCLVEFGDDSLTHGLLNVAKLEQGSN